MPFSQTIEENLPETAEEKGSEINDTDKKVNTDDVTPEEKEKQDSFKHSLDNDVADTSDDETKESEDDSEEEESDDDKDESEEDESEEESEDESDEESDDETHDKGKFDGYDTFEEYKAAKEAEKSVDAPDKDAKIRDIEAGNLKDPEKQKEIFLHFCDKHKDVLPESVKVNYEKFYDNRERAFLLLDNHLYKLTKTFDKLKDSLGFHERLEMAFNLAFKEELARKEKKKGEVISEVRTQKVNKATSQGTKSSGGKGKTVHSADQYAFAKLMGVKIK